MVDILCYLRSISSHGDLDCQDRTIPFCLRRYCSTGNVSSLPLPPLTAVLSPALAGRSSPQDFNRITWRNRYLFYFCTEVTYWIRWTQYWTTEEQSSPAGAAVDKLPGRSSPLAVLSIYTANWPTMHAILAPVCSWISYGMVSLREQVGLIHTMSVWATPTGSISYTVWQPSQLFH
jgi:hypothetical protein